MSMWTLEEREEVNSTIQYEEELRLLAYEAYDVATADKPLKKVLEDSKYKALNEYYTYDQIVNDVLYYIMQ